MNKSRISKLILLFIFLFIVPIFSYAKEIDPTCGLKSVSINGTPIEYFVYTKIGYSIEVDSSVETITIEAVPLEKTSTVTSIENKPINFGDNSFQIVCTNLKGDRQIYSFVISKYGSSEVSLEYIKVDGKILDGYTSSTFNYTLNVDPKVQSVKIEAKAVEKDMIVTGTGTKTLKEGKNTFSISCKSQNGSEYIYYVKIIKGKSDLTLSSITVDGKLIDKFSSKNTTYSWKVDDNVNKILVGATATDPKSKVTGTGEYELVGGVNTIKIKVTGEDTKTKLYTLIIQKNKEEVIESYSNSSINNDKEGGGTTVYSKSIISEEQKKEVEKVLSKRFVLTKPWIIALSVFVLCLIISFFYLRKARDYKLDSIDKNDEIKNIFEKGRRDRKL